MEHFTHFAYLDPGTGSLVLQSVVGALLGTIVVLRTKIKQVYYKIKGGTKKEELTSEE
jgi:hypothetical protein